MNQYPSTTKYEMFQLLDFNRDVKKTRKLETSMKKNGFIPAYPLHVVKDGNKLKVKAGHHRLTVAIKLGLPVYYAVCDDNASIHELEAATVNWSLQDYLSSFVRLGDNDYSAVQAYQQRTGINLGSCISMLGGQCAAGKSNFGKAFKSGEFVVKDTAHAEVVAGVVATMKKCGVKWASDTGVVHALSRIIMAGHADIPQLKARIKSHKAFIEKQPSVQAFTDMFDEIYNRGTRGARTPLAFLTSETLRQRQTAFGKTV